MNPFHSIPFGRLKMRPFYLVEALGLLGGLLDLLLSQNLGQKGNYKYRKVVLDGKYGSLESGRRELSEGLSDTIYEA